jgi:hypothetical protein
MTDRDPWLAKVLELAEAGTAIDITVVVDGQIIAGRTISGRDYQGRALAAAPALRQQFTDTPAGEFLHLDTAVFPALGPKVRSPVYWRIDVARIAAYSLARWEPNLGTR